VIVAAGLLGAVRWVTAKPPDYNKPMMQMGGFGAMPPGMIGNLIKGVDIVALVSLPLLFGWSYWISIIIAGISFFILQWIGLDDTLAHQSAHAIFMIRFLFASIPIVGLTFSLIALQRFPLTQEKMAEIRQQLEARRGKV